MEDMDWLDNRWTLWGTDELGFWNTCGRAMFAAGAGIPLNPFGLGFWFWSGVELWMVGFVFWVKFVFQNEELST